MLKNMSSLSIESFGILPPEDFINTDPSVRTKEVSTTITDLQAFYMDPLHTTVIELLEGPALLYVSLTLGGPYDSYLLDKPIRLHPHVYYRVIPLYQECQLRSHYDASTTELHQYVSGKRISSTLNKEMNLTEIYTLFYQEFDKTFDYRGESHDFWELTYVDQGELHTEVDGESFVLKQGQFIFYGPNQFHTQKNNKQAPVSFLTLSFGLEIANEKDLLRQVFSTNREIDMLLKKIIEEKDVNRAFKIDLLLCYLKILIINVLRDGKDKADLPSKLNSSMYINTTNAMINDVLTVIHNNMDKKLQVEALAKHVSLSPSYLSQTFKQVMGISIIKYLNQCRLEQSKHYIKNTDLSLTQIADILGFTSLHYFSRQFKNHYQISPSAYSRSIKK